MNLEEYELVIRTVVKEVNKKVPVIAGAGSNDTQKAVIFSKTAKNAGADALLHVTPFYNKPTTLGLIAHYKQIASNVNLPIILYNVPGRTGLNISADVTLKIAKEVDNIIGIKEASGNILQAMEIIKNMPKGFSVLSGEDSLTLPIMALGGSGCISVVSNEVPGEFSSLVESALSGKWEKAKKLHYYLLDLMNINFIETNPIPVKTALFLMGKIKEEFRLPLVNMEQKNKEILINVLGKIDLL